MTRTHLLLFLLLSWTALAAQNTYTSFRSGSSTDTITTAAGGSCLMGGATEDDNAMRWFLERAGGGDVLVLRASGADGYNNYFLNELGVAINSVETIVFNDATAATDTYVLDRIRQAEAIWFAGGDQFDYVDYWRGTDVARLINEAVRDRNVVIGGTSAGMAILGGFYFTAANGTVTSAAALADPFDPNVTVDSADFFKVPYLENVITDTHYDDPDRRGRHFAFLARITNDYTPDLAFGIACEEYTAVCIDPSGTARVFGGQPEYDDNAYFLQVTCGTRRNRPDTITAGEPLTWNNFGMAVAACRLPGTPTGENTFDLNAWFDNDEAGTWEFWTAERGEFVAQPAQAPNCLIDNVNDSVLAAELAIRLSPNPATDRFTVSFTHLTATTTAVTVYDATGRQLTQLQRTGPGRQEVEIAGLVAGSYTVALRLADGRRLARTVVVR